MSFMPAAPTSASGAKRKRHTISDSCTSCRRNKVKCDEEKPCSRCVRNGRQASCESWREVKATGKQEGGNGLRGATATTAGQLRRSVWGTVSDSPSHLLYTSAEALTVAKETTEAAVQCSQISPTVANAAQPIARAIVSQTADIIGLILRERRNLQGIVDESLVDVCIGIQQAACTVLGKPTTESSAILRDAEFVASCLNETSGDWSEDESDDFSRALKSMPIPMYHDML